LLDYYAILNEKLFLMRNINSETFQDINTTCSI